MIPLLEVSLDIVSGDDKCKTSPLRFSVTVLWESLAVGLWCGCAGRCCEQDDSEWEPHRLGNILFGNMSDFEVLFNMLLPHTTHHSLYFISSLASISSYWGRLSECTNNIIYLNPRMDKWNQIYESVQVVAWKIPPEISDMVLPVSHHEDAF